MKDVLITYWLDDCDMVVTKGMKTGVLLKSLLNGRTLSDFHIDIYDNPMWFLKMVLDFENVEGDGIPF